MLRRTKLAIMPASVSTVGSGRVKPCDSLSPMAQPVSRRPEMKTRNHDMRGNLSSRRLVLTGYDASRPGECTATLATTREGGNPCNSPRVTGDLQAIIVGAGFGGIGMA